MNYHVADTGDLHKDFIGTLKFTNDEELANECVDKGI